MNNSLRIILIFSMLVGVGWISYSAGQTDRKKVKRVKRPVFKESETKLSYYDDIFKDGLKGERPKTFSAKPSGLAQKGSGTTSTEETAGDGFSWSSLIPASAIEMEVKQIKISLDKTITTPGKFRSGDYQDTRREMSVLAMMFAIISEYDGEVRWKKVATDAREAFARCAANCSVGTQQSYSQAKNRKVDLQDILGGGSVSFTEKGEGPIKWGKICDRNPLMQRLETAYLERIKPWTASKSEFNKNKEQLAKEAAVVAAIAEVLMRDGLEDSDDEDYSKYCVEMRTGALGILSAIKDNEDEKASSAAGVIDKSCNNCHDEWK